MGTIIDYLTNDFLKFFGGFSLVGILVGILVYLSRLMAKQIFNQKMADYQGLITGELEKLKLQQQKNFKDFELFTSKKHEKYPEMFLHLETAYGEVFDLQGIKEIINFENANEEDLKLYFDDLLMTNFDQDRILGIWRSGRSAAIDEIRKIERIIHYRRAEEKWREANNYYYFILLYFSDAVSKACKDLIDHLREYLIYLNPKYEFTSPEEMRARKDLKDILPEIRNSVKTEMQKELRIE